MNYLDDYETIDYDKHYKSSDSVNYTNVSGEDKK